MTRKDAKTKRFSQMYRANVVQPLMTLKPGCGRLRPAEYEDDDEFFVDQPSSRDSSFVENVTSHAEIVNSQHHFLQSPSASAIKRYHQAGYFSEPPNVAQNAFKRQMGYNHQVTDGRTEPFIEPLRSPVLRLSDGDIHDCVLDFLKCYPNGVLLSEFAQNFRKCKNRFGLKPEELWASYGCNNIFELLTKLWDIVELEGCQDGDTLIRIRQEISSKGAS